MSGKRVGYYLCVGGGQVRCLMSGLLCCWRDFWVGLCVRGVLVDVLVISGKRCVYGCVSRGFYVRKFLKMCS